MKTFIEKENSQEFERLVIQLFENHYDFHKDIGVDFVKSASGHTTQVSADYQGRVLYELLQNAFDRAKDKVLVKVVGKSLFVANDGKKFTFNSDHDYKKGGVEGEIFKRSDFHSLCSISTSNKTASESIGNKGVGFKSVYALGRYADIHTKGVVSSNSHTEEGSLSFRLFDIFDSVDDIPQGFDDNTKDHLIDTVKSIQREFPQRGVPGYYFPLELDIDSDTIFREFDDEMVTVVEVPFDSKEEVEELIDQIRKIHFEFVSLKYSNEFDIKFEANGLTFTKTSFSKDNTLFYANLNLDKIEPLAKKAGVKIEDFKVAIKFKNTPNGLFYNYLPTAKESPFKYVDFHADFHTTVDRKNINFEGNKIGAYNRALLDACIELYFLVLRSYTANPHSIEMKVECINDPEISLDNFLWKWDYIELYESKLIYDKSRCLFVVHDYIDQYNIDNNKHYTNFVLLLSSIAYRFFENIQEDEIHRVFFKNSVGFIHSFTCDYKTRYSRAEEFKKELFNEIKRLNARVVPNINLLETSEVLYRKKENKGIKLPDILPIKITDFEILDEFVKDVLGVKDYSQPNEILKHFKQCSFSGAISDENITELEQKQILKCCYELFLTKDEVEYLSSHRYTKAYNTNLRETNRTLNQSNFNISTLFLKLENGRYKPAQLCVKSELDLDFLDFIERTDLDNWLRYLGVSVETNYRFVDIEIYSKLKDGLEKLPQLLLRHELKDNIDSALIKNVRVDNLNNDLTHPALINDNNYSFFKNIKSNSKLKSEFDNLLVKNYNQFPKEYLDILKKRLTDNFTVKKNDIIQFYQNVFEAYDRIGIYLVIEDNQLKWVQETDFYILGIKSDFELCIKKFPSKKILTYHLGRSDRFKDRIITPKKGDITYSSKIDYDELKDVLSERIPYLLINLSHSKNSDKDYLSEDTDLSTLQDKLEMMSIYKCNNLMQDLSYADLGSDRSPKAYAYNLHDLFLSENFTKSQVTQGICDFLFSNITIKDQAELVIFHKELEELHIEVDNMELQVINRKWKPDYQEKFTEFQKEILSIYNRTLKDNEEWYKYSKNHQSDFLIELDKKRTLHELEKEIEIRKVKYDGYFDMFKLEISYDHIVEDIYILESYCESNEVIEDLKKRVQILIEKANSRRLGLEKEINDIKNEYPEVFSAPRNEKEIKSKRDDSNRIYELKRIYEKVKLGSLKEIDYDTLDTSNQSAEVLSKNYKQIMYQGKTDITANNRLLEITGATGEVEVLTCLIHEFLKLSSKEQLKGIEAVRTELKRHTGNGSFDIYAEDCKRAIGDDEKLMMALIPFFYVTNKYKYSYFDLITYKEGKPTLVEVKTTINSKSKKFYLSIAEVDIARSSSNYEIVRVTPDSIIFFGNPIKDIEENIFEVKTDGFDLKPRNYELIIK